MLYQMPFVLKIVLILIMLVDKPAHLVMMVQLLNAKEDVKLHSLHVMMDALKNDNILVFYILQLKK